jgi:hypothetical protein
MAGHLRAFGYEARYGLSSVSEDATVNIIGNVNPLAVLVSLAVIHCNRERENLCPVLCGSEFTIAGKIPRYGN